MRIVHSSRRTKADIKGLSRDEAFKLGMQAEQQDDADQAILIYHSLIDAHSSYEPAYLRLLILYRKAKDYKKEIEILDRLIETFLAAYSKHTRIKASPSITRLSSILAKSTGLADKKGKPQFEPDKVIKWRKRREIAVKRMKK